MINATTPLCVKNRTAKKICFVTTLPVTLKAFVSPQAKHLIENGWEVTFISANDPDFICEIPEGVRYIPVDFKRGTDLFGVPRFILKLYKIFRREHFDLVQYSTPNAAFYASTAAWLARIPVRLYAQWGIRYVGFNGLQRKLFKVMEGWCCDRSTIVEPDSQSNLNFSVNEGLYSKDKARVIWNGSAIGVNLARFNIEKKTAWRAEYREMIGLKPHHLVVGFVGSIRRDKGCNELVSACRSFFNTSPDARLLLVGDKSFYDTVDQELRDWIAGSNQVIVIPPNSEIPQYMSCMDVFCLPSYREGFGLVVVEAEAMGLPVIVSDVPGPIDAMHNEISGFIVPVKNTEALSVALCDLLHSEEKRELFSVAAYAFARDNFSQDKFLHYVLKDKESLLTSN